MNVKEALRTLDEEFGSESIQNKIAHSVVEHLTESELHKVVFGVFENCREYGLTLTLNEFQICFYEHRNSDQIHLEGCETKDIKEYGPYGGVNKFDTLAHVESGDFSEMARLVSEALYSMKYDISLTRSELKNILEI